MMQRMSQRSLSLNGWRYVAVVLFLGAMAAVAELTGQRETLFPEAGALCVGLWLMPKSVWNVRAWQIPFLLTLAALVGLAVNCFVPFGFALRFLLAFCGVALLLRVVRCNMYPVVSAAMLPVLIGTTSWVYPVSVLVLSILLALGRRWLPQTTRVDYHPFGLMHWVWLAAALGLFVAATMVVQRLGRQPRLVMVRFAMVPPLVVTMIEFANRRSGFRKRPCTIWVLLVVAAVVGTASEWVLHRLAGIPAVLGVALSTTVMLLFFRRFKPFAPALAIVLVPLLLPYGVLMWFPLLVTVGAAYFIASGMLLSTRRRGEKSYFGKNRPVRRQ